MSVGYDPRVRVRLDGAVGVEALDAEISRQNMTKIQRLESEAYASDNADTIRS